MSGQCVKSFWICCGAVSFGLVLASATTASAARKPAARAAVDLTNFVLSPANSLWLVGSVAHIATEKEIDAYLKLTDDSEAQAFIDEFWNARRSSDIVWPAPQPGEIFERRAKEADAQFSEGTHLGRRSDRGTVFILHGEPEARDYESSNKRYRDESYEVWRYPKDAGPGLDGEPPKREYFFIKDGEKTVFHIPGARRRGSILPRN